MVAGLVSVIVELLVEQPVEFVDESSAATGQCL